MSENIQKNPWNVYQNEYRKKNPEAVARWRYQAAKRLVAKYEQEHPEALKHPSNAGGNVDE